MRDLARIALLDGDSITLRAEGSVPGLAVVLVGNDPASEVYVRSKTQACEEVGMRGRTLRFPADVVAQLRPPRLRETTQEPPPDDMDD